MTTATLATHCSACTAPLWQRDGRMLDGDPEEGYCLGPESHGEPIEFDVDATIRQLRADLKRRTGRTWSVKRGRGTVYCWITVIAPPARRDGPYGSMSDDDRKVLSDALGTEVHHQGYSIPASAAYRREALDRAAGRTPSVVAEPYWD